MSLALALKNEKSATNNVLSKLIVADIAPSTGNLSPEFIRYISAMQEIEALAPGVIKTRADADKKLQSYEQVNVFFTLYSFTYAKQYLGCIYSPIPPYQPSASYSLAQRIL